MNKKLKYLNEMIAQVERLQVLQITAQARNLSSYPSPDYAKVITNLATAMATMTTAKTTVEEGVKEDGIPF